MLDILIPLLILSVIGAVCALLLVIAAKYFASEENEREVALRECLPGANCGACGFSGCDAYAKALSEGETEKTNLCIPGGDKTAKAIAGILGKEAEDVTELVAFVACGGTCDASGRKYDYRGTPSCFAANAAYNGDRFCNFACLGYGDCMKVCPNNAIAIEGGIAKIESSKCVGCGLCAKTCPNGIIHLVKDTTRVVVKCSNKNKGADVRKICKSGCIGCMKCEKNCPTGAITVKDNLAVIDYEKCTSCGLCVEICPVHCLEEGSFLCGSRFSVG
jgi:Na+-translocating ferredoxin:NAD+ oxidoreductase RNF subunit RnfB